MSVRPVPDLTVPMNVGFEESDTSPIIHSIRWRHLPSKRTFSDVKDVITYHISGTTVIDIKAHVVSYLDVYFLRNANISEVMVYLRFVRASDGVLIEEPYTVGEGGKTIKLENDEFNTNLSVIKGIAFTQRDLGDGTPLYDFMSMAEEGTYEVWVKAKTSDGKELHIRIPFQWSNLVPGSDDGGGGGDKPELPPNDGKDHSPVKDKYDEYYVTVVEGVSPFTKRPSSHYRQAAVGMLYKPYCFKRIDTPSQSKVENPVDVPIIGEEPPKQECDLQLKSYSITKNVGEDVTFELIHSNNSGVVSIDVNYDQTALTEVSDTTFTILKEGSNPIEFTVVYSDGQECKVTGYAIGIPKPAECDLTVNVTPDTIKVGDMFVIDIVHTNTSGLKTIVVSYPNNKFDSVDKSNYKALEEGTFTFEIDIEYLDGQKCHTEVTVTVGGGGSSKPANCGDMMQGGTGYDVFVYDSITQPGTYYIEYDFLSLADRMYVYAGDKLLVDTGEVTYSTGSPFAFNYDPADGVLKVQINDGDETLLTAWSFTLYCPDNVPQHVKDNAVLKN